MTSTITHEIGYCVTDGGLIDENANGLKEITSIVTVMLGLLYTVAPGTHICDRSLASRFGSMNIMSRYQADGGKRYSHSWN